MITAGIDLGWKHTRVVLLEDGNKILIKKYIPTTFKLEEDAERLYNDALNDVGIKATDVNYIVATGAGRYRLKFRNANVTELTAGALGAKFLFPNTRTVIDIGTTQTRVMKIDDKGKVIKFMTNDRCAAGAGAFLERVALYTQVNLPDLGNIALQSKSPVTISTVCSVLAETEIINLLTLNTPLEDILMGAVNSIVGRVMPLIRVVGIQPEITLIGGTVLNPALIKSLSNNLKASINATMDTFYAGAIGAALLGYKRLMKMKCG